ncbi:VOC family protein [Paenibacillus sp. NPDC058910]|uniref:VOC family protein n=1 Tax=unclassified Paenibacillus TaxID=185978 RepID=UPI00369D1307
MNILKVEVRTKQLAMIKKFYVDLLEFEVKKDADERLELQAGRSTIEFVQDHDSRAFYHIAFSIAVDQLSEAMKWLENNGIELITQDGNQPFEFKDWPASACYFYDPDGNLIEFIAHHATVHEQADSFNAKHIIAISEIGLPVVDVREEIRRLHEVFGLSLWRGDGKLFAAMGDENGLLIVIDKHRPWFPVHIKPGMFPTVVLIQGLAPEEQHLVVNDGLYIISSLSL